jgi:replication-associated recombination protein RarA
MLHAGEDFLHRATHRLREQMLVLLIPEASHHIATQKAVGLSGFPEARIPLAHATAYMCHAKSREAYGAECRDGKIEQTQRVPERLRTTFPGEPER